MATIDDFGGTGQTLADPALGGPNGWAAAVRDALRELQRGLPDVEFAVVSLPAGSDPTVNTTTVDGVTVATIGLPVGDDGLTAYEVAVENGFTGDEAAWLATLAGPLAQASLINFTQSGTGAVPRTVQDRLKDTINVKDFGAVGDGTTDDTAAIEAALAAGAAKCVLFPPGVYAVAKAGRLPAITAPFTALVGDDSGSAVLRFTHPDGGLDIGDGTDFVYDTRLKDLIIDGMDVCETPIRMRKAEEARFQDVRVKSAAGACIEISDSNLCHFDMLQMVNSPVGMLLGTHNGALNFTRNNHYALEEVFRAVDPTGVTSLMFGVGGWVENCRHFLTFACPTTAGWGRVLIYDSHFTSTYADLTLMRAVGGRVSNSRFEISDCTINYVAATGPLIDFTAVDNSEATVRFVLSNLLVTLPLFGSQVLVKPCPTQVKWYNFYVELANIRGLAADQWSTTPGVVGGVRHKPPIMFDVGAPEGVAKAPPGALYQDSGGPLYAKLTGTGSTGWSKVFTLAAKAAANPDTSGATLAQLETEVNELKAALRTLGLMST